MAIVGVQCLVYGVEDLDGSVKFYEDFGLPMVRRGPQGADFGLPEGSQVLLRQRADPTLPPPFEDGSGAREVIWGVDSAKSFDSIEKSLASDRDVKRAGDGTLHTRDDLGIPIGFRVFERVKPAPIESVENTLGNIKRWNAHRKWFQRAEPKLIHHVVFGVPDIDRGVAFYTRRLNFRITDVSYGNGVFIRF